MQYDIYFHNDFDGRASAAAVLAFLENRGDSVAHFTPVDYHMEKQWIDENFFTKHKLFKGKRHPAIVVDFSYHPKAAMWFDHHPTAFKRDDWKKRFVPGPFRMCKPKYPSCTHLVYAALKAQGWKPAKHFKDLVIWLDIIDGALYKNPQQTLEIKEPALEVAAYIDENNDDAKASEWIVRQLATRPLADIAKEPKVKKIATKIRIKNQKGMLFYKKHLKRQGNATFIDLTKSKIETLRFASYVLFPKVRYAVRFTVKDGFYRLGIGSNPWMRSKESVHLGEFLRHYGGGGHKGAAAVGLGTDRKKAEATIEEIMERLSASH